MPCSPCETINRSKPVTQTTHIGFVADALIAELGNSLEQHPAGSKRGVAIISKGKGMD
jgi:hypothetical protein